MKVLFMTNIPSPYRVDFFNELGKNCDLTVAFTNEYHTNRDKSWKNFKFENFKGVFLRGVTIKGLNVCFGIKKIIKKGAFDKIICANFTDITGMIAINYMRRHRIQFYLESDGGFVKKGKGIKEKIKRWCVKGAQGYFSTAEEHDKYYLAYGATQDKLIRYPFSSIKDFEIEKSIVTLEKKLFIRKNLGVKEEKVVLAVGQFIHRKGFDILLKASEKFPSNIGVYFIGGEPTKEYLKYKKDNIHFVGFKSRAELKEYYRMADVFVLPTREDIWGLVINEAMACGLPVITTDRCIAGLELIQNGENGYIVPVDDSDALAKKVNEVMQSDKVREKMSKNNLTKIRYWTVESMVKKHLEVLGMSNKSS